MLIQILTTILLWDIQGNEREKIFNISLKSFIKKCHKKLTNLERKKKRTVFLRTNFFSFSKQNKTIFYNIKKKTKSF